MSLSLRSRNMLCYPFGPSTVKVLNGFSPGIQKQWRLALIIFNRGEHDITPILSCYHSCDVVLSSVEYDKRQTPLFLNAGREPIQYFHCGGPERVTKHVS